MKMINPLIFLLIAGIAAAQSSTGKYELNSLDGKNDHRRFQSTIPSIEESTTGQSIHEGIQSAQIRKHSNAIDKSIVHEDKISQITSQAFPPHNLLSGRSPISQNSGIKSEQNLFQSERLTPAVLAPPQSSEHESFNDFSHQAQVYGGEPVLPNQEQFLGNRQEMHGQEEFYNGRQEAPEQQQFFDGQQTEQEQQRFFGNRQEVHEQRQFFGEVPERRRAFSDVQSRQNQQQFSSRQPSPVSQQFYSNIQMGVGDQRVSSGNGLQTVSHLKSSQVYSNKLPTDFHTREIKGNARLSAFNNREQPIMLPRGTSLHSSSSVFVSGLNSLPMLPAMVYNAGPLPSSHAVAVSKGTPYQASIRHHMQTPYVRYVYSHLL